MSNTIKLKRGSGSDPGTSDLVVGEVAVRTDNGKLFTKKDDGTIAEISGSGGGGISDGDKGDITVSNSGDTFTIDNGVVTSAKITDGTIVNADINASAAIALSKLATGTLPSGLKVNHNNLQTGIIENENVSSSAAIEGSKIQAAGLVNAGVMTAAQHNKLAGIEANATADMTATEILAVISGENIILGTVSSTGNSSFAGNLTVSSSDGGSSAAPEIDIYRNSASPADADYLGQIKFTGESDDGSKEVYAKITGKIGDASSGTEDGILEIAHTKAGSNNISARFTSTDLKLINGTGLEVAGNISCDGTVDGRDVATDGTKLDGIETGATADQTAAEILTLIKTVDGAGSGLDADTLDGVNSGSFVRSDQSDTMTGNLTLQNTAPKLNLVDTNNNSDYQVTNYEGTFRIFDTTNSANRLILSANGEIEIGGNLNLGAGCDVTGNITVSGTVDGRDVATDGSKLDGIESGATADQSNSEIKTAYEANSNTNAFTDALLSKLNGIAASATNVTNTNQLTNGAGFITATLTNEQVQDIVGGMVTGNTETGITVTYQDGDGTLDFVVGTLNQDTTGNAATATTLETARTIAGGSFDGSANISLNNNAITNGAGYITSSDSSITNKLPLAGGTLTGDLTISNSAPKILLTDTNNDPDYQLKNFNGVFELDQGTSDTKFKITTDGHVEFPNDDQEIRIGQGSDLILVHDGSDSIINDAGTGNLKLQLGGSTKLEITSAGATLTGDAAVSGSVTAPRISGSNGIIEMKAEIGTSQTLTTGYNAIAVDPTIANGVTITVPSGAVWSIV